MKSRRLLAFLTIVFCLLLAGCSSPANQAAKDDLSYRQVSAEEAKRMMDEEENYVILDVRTTEEFSEGWQNSDIQMLLNLVESAVGHMKLKRRTKNG